MGLTAFRDRLAGTLKARESRPSMLTTAPEPAPRRRSWAVTQGHDPIPAPEHMIHPDGPWCLKPCPLVGAEYRHLWLCSRRPNHSGRCMAVTDDGWIVAVWETTRDTRPASEGENE